MFAAQWNRETFRRARAGGGVTIQVNQDEVWTPGQVVAKYRQAKKKGAKHLLLFVDGIGGYRFSLLPVR